MSKLAPRKQTEIKSHIQSTGRLNSEKYIKNKKAKSSSSRINYKILSKGAAKSKGKKLYRFMNGKIASKNSGQPKMENLGKSKEKKSDKVYTSSNVNCKFHGSCSEDHYPIGSLHVVEGGHGGHNGYIDYGHHGISYDSDHGIDYGHHGTGGFDHLGTDYGHNGHDGYHSIGYGIGYGHHGEDYGHHGMDYGHHDMDYGHHDLDYGHHDKDYGHHDMDYGHHGHDHHLHIEPIHVAEEHHNHVMHHVEPVPVPVPVAVPVSVPSNPASAVANKAAADAVANKAPAGIAVSALNMNGGQATATQNNAAQTVNTGYPVYYLPPAAPPVGKPAPNLVKPAPPANGPNPYEILTSDTLKEAAGQQKNEANGGSSGENPQNGNPPDAGNNSKDNGENKDGDKSSNDNNKDDKKPSGLITGGTKHRPVNTEVDHSSHFSKRRKITQSKINLRHNLKRRLRSLASVLLAGNPKYNRNSLTNVR